MTLAARIATATAELTAGAAGTNPAALVETPATMRARNTNLE